MDVSFLCSHPPLDHITYTVTHLDPNGGGAKVFPMGPRLWSPLSLGNHGNLLCVWVILGGPSTTVNLTFLGLDDLQHLSVLYDYIYTKYWTVNKYRCIVCIIKNIHSL